MSDVIYLFLWSRSLQYHDDYKDQSQRRRHAIITSLLLQKRSMRQALHEFRPNFRMTSLKNGRCALERLIKHCDHKSGSQRWRGLSNMPRYQGSWGPPGAHLGPTWVPPHVGPINLSVRVGLYTTPVMDNAKLWRFYQKCGIFWIPVIISVMCRYVSASGVTCWPIWKWCLAIIRLRPKLTGMNVLNDVFIHIKVWFNNFITVDTNMQVAFPLKLNC